MQRITCLASYIEARSIPITECGCWWWTGRLNHKGYGFCSQKVVGATRAHRLSWMVHRGPIPDGMFVLHTCDTPCCVNPDHLFLGTHAENMRDMVAKVRGRGPGRKLSPAAIRVIRSSTGAGIEVARQFGVTSTTIYKIRNRETYRDIDDIGVPAFLHAPHGAGQSLGGE